MFLSPVKTSVITDSTSEAKRSEKRCLELSGHSDVAPAVASSSILPTPTRPEEVAMAVEDVPIAAIIDGAVQ
jgi:hypothetical protein